MIFSSKWSVSNVYFRYLWVGILKGAVEKSYHVLKPPIFAKTTEGFINVMNLFVSKVNKNIA